MSSHPLPPPSKRWYRVAVGLAVVGLVAAAAWWPVATTRVFDAVEAFERTGPFGGAVELRTSGTHTFWVEGSCLTCHQNDPGTYRAAATVAVVDPRGRRLELRPAPARLYNTARREGRALWLFDVVAPGPHQVSLDFDTSGDWESTRPANVAVGRGEGLPVGIVGPMASMSLAGAAAGAALTAVTAVRRRRHYRRGAAGAGLRA